MHLMTLFLVSLGLLLLPTVAHAQPAYTVAEIGGLAGFAEVYPAAVNSTGHVVGTARDPETGLEQAVVWRNGTLLDLGTLGGRLSRGFDISDADLVVGESFTGASEGDIHAFVWDGEVMLDLGRPGRDSGADAINAAGQIVGYERDVGGNMHAMIWERGEGHRLDHFDFGYSQGRAINSAGQAVLVLYWSGPGGSAESYLWENGTLADLGSFEAVGLNALGDVIGFPSTPIPITSGFVWRAGTRHDLEGVGSEALPWATNDIGQAVGSTRMTTGAEHAFLWDGGVMVDLNDSIDPGSGWELWRATGINTAGQITGFGSLHGQQRAFLLTPLPSSLTAVSSPLDDVS
jgi:probable HAF family extracellular repeat protein